MTLFLDDLSPPEREAMLEVEAAEDALELARLRLIAVTNRSRRASRGHLRLVRPSPVDGEPCDARR
jgi:hypothetical protein